MNNCRTNFFTSKHRGMVSLVTIILISILVIVVVLIGFGDRASAISSKAQATFTELGSIKSLIFKPKVEAGVMNGIIYNPPNSSAVVDTITLHEGDRIHDVLVVAIHENSVEFAKDGVSWRQNVLDRPNAAWTAQAKDRNSPAK